MRACAAILILAATLCFIPKINSCLNGVPTDPAEKESIFYQIFKCVRDEGLTGCFGYAVAYWRFYLLMGGFGECPKDYSWQAYRNISNEELYVILKNDTERLLQQRSFQMDLSEDYGLKLGLKGNGTLSVDIIKHETAAGRSSMKTLTKHFYNVMPFLLIPGLIMSAILPFFLPTLKMMTLAAGMLNNMALTGAVFTFLRNNAFNDNYKKKVIYVNDGYFNDKYEPLADTPSEVIVDNFDGKFGDFETHDLKDFNFVESNPIDTDYRLNSEWLRQLTTGKVKNVKIIPEKFSPSDWRKQDDLGKDAVTDGKIL